MQVERTADARRAAGGLIGRAAEAATIRYALDGARLVTVTGPPGVGKTAVSLAVASAAAGSFADGSLLLRLDTLRDEALLPHTIAAALRLPDQFSRSRLDVLVDQLRDRHLLLILDTCEHLLGACAALVAALLLPCPKMQVLATSREPLRVPGEATVAAAARCGWRTRWSCSAGGRRRPGWRSRRSTGPPWPRSACTWTSCRWPSSWRRPNSPDQASRACALTEMLARLEAGHDLPRGSGEDGRHRTMRAAIGWSHGLCTPPERLLWARLSVFTGPFGPQDARDVCASSELPDEAVAAGLSLLAERSVLLAGQHGGHACFLLPAMMRAYGREMLRRLGQDDEFAARHRRWQDGRRPRHGVPRGNDRGRRRVNQPGRPGHRVLGRARLLRARLRRVIAGQAAGADEGMKLFRGERQHDAEEAGHGGHTTARAEVMAGAQAAPRGDRRRISARPVRRRPGPGRTADRGGGRALPGLLQEPGHRRDHAAARRAGRGVGRARAPGRDVPRRAHQRVRGPRGAARGAAHAGRRSRWWWTAPTSWRRCTRCSAGWRTSPRRVRSGEWKGYTGKPIRNVVNVGIGGSDLGPVMAYEALRHYATRDITFRFVSNVDSTDFAEATRDLDPAETLFIISSKTFGTLETLTNATSARDWVVSALGSRGRGGQALRRGVHQRRAGREVRHRHRQHVRLLGLGRRPVLDGVGDRPVHHGRDRPGAVRRDAGRVPRDGRALPHRAARAEPAGADGPARGVVPRLLRLPDATASCRTSST